MVRVNDVFELEGVNYIALKVCNLNNNEYIFTNVLNENEEPTKNFKLFRQIPKGLIEVKNQEELNNVLPTFSRLINDDILKINEEYMNTEV